MIPRRRPRPRNVISERREAVEWRERVLSSALWGSQRVVGCGRGFVPPVVIRSESDRALNAVVARLEAAYELQLAEDEAAS